MSSDAASSYRRYRAPRHNNSAVAVPPLNQVSTNVDSSIDALQLGSENLGKLRSLARQELIGAALRYTSQYLTVEGTPASKVPLLLTGHQAELFHPGVWYKNFALSKLAEHHNGVGIHLVIDTNTNHNSSIRVPTGTTREPRIEGVPFDVPAVAQPVEQKQVVDQDLFASFGKRASETIRPLLGNPLVESWWPEVINALGQTSNNGHYAIARARHQLEHAWGAKTLELPMSQACGLSVFAPFVSGLLVEAPKLWDAYNGALSAYRQAHRLRTSAQPMPDLAKEDDWLEMPFWVWTADRPERRALFVRTRSGELELTDRADWITTISSDAQRATEQLRDIANVGLKIRTRALTTTLYARLVLGDVFLHGIGGAKYDEVTDDLARRLWGIEPPPYVALSATLQLPIDHQSESTESLQKAEQNLRDWQWHPERWVGDVESSEAQKAVRAKRQWVQLSKTVENASERHQQINAANETLRRETSEVGERLLQEQSMLRDEARAIQVLESREYTFCLFPEQDLRERIWKLV